VQAFSGQRDGRDLPDVHRHCGPKSIDATVRQIILMEQERLSTMTRRCAPEIRKIVRHRPRRYTPTAGRSDVRFQEVMTHVFVRSCGVPIRMGQN
jgi:hypothetical protein